MRSSKKRMDKSTNPLVTVVVPCYNGERFVDRCLSSIERQTYKNLQVLLVNDGSTDGSVERAMAYPFVTIVNNDQNRGLSFSRNHGMELAQGKYIHFFDVDDEINSHFYESLVRYAEQSGAEVTASGFVFQQVPEKSQLFRRHRVYKGTVDKLKVTYVCKIGVVWRYLFRTDFLRAHEDLTFPVGQLVEDLAFSVKALYYADKVATAPGAEYLYRCEPGSITLTEDPEKRKAFDEGYRKERTDVESFLGSHGVTRMPGYSSDMISYVLHKLGNILRGRQTDLTERL